MRQFRRWPVLVASCCLWVPAITLIGWHLNGGSMLAVQSNSMQPLYRKGDLVLVRRTSGRQLTPGQVVVYKSLYHANQTLAHRIVSIDGGYMTAKGDNLAVEDPAVPVSYVIGRVVVVVPLAGKISGWLRQPLGLACLIYVPALVVAVEELYRLRLRQPKHYRLVRPTASNSRITDRP